MQSTQTFLVQRFNFRGSAQYVRLGEHDLDRSDDARSIDFRIIDKIPHPDYRSSLKYNDIGLFKLDRKVEFSKAIRPACLPEQESVGTNAAIATGWGKVSTDGNPSNVLLKVVLNMFSQDECNSTYGRDKSRHLPNGIIEESQVCAGSHTEEKDTCQGDSGD